VFTVITDPAGAGYVESLARPGGNVTGFLCRSHSARREAGVPVQFPTKFEMVLNLKAAKALGLAVPPSILLRAGEQIE
jgi:putative ABC transport system substrate-binding protein